MVSDNTVNLFQIADVSQLLVSPTAPRMTCRPWRTSTATNGGGPCERPGQPATGLPGTIAEIGYMIDPNQHTAVVKGYVENPGSGSGRTQYVTATVNIPPPDDVVEIPVDALVRRRPAELVFVQPDAAKHQFTMRRVQVTHRFDRTVFVRPRRSPRKSN